MFAAGLISALMLATGLSIAVSITARRRGYPPERDRRPTLAEAGHAFRGGSWALLFPVILLVGLRSGVFTLSEIGAAAVVYALFVGVAIYRRLTGRSFIEALEVSLGDIGAVIFLVALSAIFGYGIVLERIPELVSSAMLGLTDNLYAVMALIATFTILAGFVVDATVLIIMLTPIFLPLIRNLGGDPVHFGIVFIIAATIGNFTPPIGTAMYTVCSILKVKVGAYTRESLPLLLSVFLVTLLLVFLPGVVLFLPKLMFR
ncbi:TRAP transporter large permease subunit [Cereibacter johrii]|uniref:Tripartite ATP-independent transporter DctM subunit n=1 Tax=Cereibacter johrii TaxID=445629 RepID=A0ABX5J3W6_9RHOB|nr:TRAP transporter large permease subunit [Cereibacter johrii]PTM76852.1 tripartite ATP-independent transporter DctM subunit [Cereibacter johrii]